MIYRALVVWLAMIAVETIHGIVRRWLLVPVVGERLSNQMGVFIGSVLIIVVVYALYGWLNVFFRQQQFLVGLLWCALTFIFELGLGYGLGYSLDQMLVDYKPGQGGFMLFGMAVMLFSLMIAAKLRACFGKKSIES